MAVTRGVFSFTNEFRFEEYDGSNGQDDFLDKKRRLVEFFMTILTAFLRFLLFNGEGCRGTSFFGSCEFVNLGTSPSGPLEITCRGVG